MSQQFNFNSKDKLPISVTIICQNEVERISKTVKSVIDWVDDITVIDSGSTDGTIELLEGMGIRVIHNPWPGFGQQKRFAEEHAKHNWILNLDADEYVLPNLASEIQKLFAVGKPDLAAYRIPIHDIFLCSGKISTYVLHNYVRLYNKSVVRYRDSAVHDTVVISNDQNVGQLKGKMAHESLKSFRHRVEKMNDYTDAQVADMRQKGRRLSKTRLILELWWTFWVSYIIRGYWRNGLMGYIYSVNFAYSRFLRLTKLLEAESKE